MKPKISIGACRRAIWIAGGGIPLMIRGEQVLITRDLRTQGQRWVSGDIRLPRASLGRTHQEGAGHHCRGRPPPHSSCPANDIHPGVPEGD